MKNFLVAMVFLASLSALANPFDGFVGKYQTSGSPKITNDNANFCDRFNFSKIVGLDIEKNTAGYMQSHILYIRHPMGWSGHPTEEYKYVNEFGGGSYATTSGSTTLAKNERGSFGANPNEKETLTVSIEKTGANFIFSMVEALYENNVFTAACYYQVKLVKK